VRLTLRDLAATGSDAELVPVVRLDERGWVHLGLRLVVEELCLSVAGKAAVTGVVDVLGDAENSRLVELVVLRGGPVHVVLNAIAVSVGLGLARRVLEELEVLGALNRVNIITEAQLDVFRVEVRGGAFVECILGGSSLAGLLLDLLGQSNGLFILLLGEGSSLDLLLRLRVAGELIGELGTLLVHWLRHVSRNAVVLGVVEARGEVVHPELNVLLDDGDAGITVDQVGGVRALGETVVLLEVMARELTIPSVVHLFSALEDGRLVELIKLVMGQLYVVLDTITVGIGDIAVILEALSDDILGLLHVNVGRRNVGPDLFKLDGRNVVEQGNDR